MNARLFVTLLGVSLLAAGCETKKRSAQVRACVQACEHNLTLKNLQPKVIYKPIKLCKQRCEATEGTCSDQKPPTVSLRQCIFYGVNAGRPASERGPLLR